MKPTILEGVPPTPYSADFGSIQLEDQLEFCRTNIGTPKEWQPITIWDEEGPSEVLALCHPATAKFLVHTANNHDMLVNTLSRVVAHLEWLDSGDGESDIDSLEAAKKALEIAEAVRLAPRPPETVKETMMVSSSGRRCFTPKEWAIRINHLVESDAPIVDGPEPYRAAAMYLGLGHYEGLLLWQEMMDEVEAEKERI